MFKLRTLGQALAVLVLTAGTTAAAAPEWPSQPVNLVVPYPPGGPTDIVARVVAEELGKRLGQTVIVDNRAGAGGNIGADVVARAAPNGHTLLIATTAHAINMSLFKNLTYDTRNSFEPVTLLTEGPLMLVTRPDLGVSNVKELVDLAETTQGGLTFASSGNGQSTHLAAELFASMADVELVHVPYKGSAPAMTDLMGGQVDMMFNTMLSSMPFVQDGKLKALAITSAQRSQATPDLPTVSEAGFEGYEATAWNGLLAPKGTPDDVLAKLNAALKEVLGEPSVKERFSAQGFDARWMTTGDFGEFVDHEIAKWAEVVETSSATVN